MTIRPIDMFLILYIAATLLSWTNSIANSDFPNERNALVQLRDILNSSTSNLHSNWTGPPCLKNHSRWAGISCSNAGHVTHLVLEGTQIKSSIPPMLLQNLTFLSKLSFRNNSIYGNLPNLSGLVNLQFLFLSHNQFSGSIPFSYVVDLPKLTKLELQDNYLQGSIPPFDQQTLIALNLSHNQLQGPIPQTPVLQRFSDSSYDNNSKLCGRPLPVQCPLPPISPSPAAAAPPTPSRARKGGGINHWRIALIAAAAAFVLFSIIIFFLCYYNRRNQNKENKTREGLAGDDGERRVELEFFDKSRTRVFDLDDLLRASAEVIGRGKLGTTYKAVVEDNGLTVVVKRLKEMNDLSKKEFVQQMQLLGKLKHENVVQLISYYYAREEKLLIYEYIPQGISLFELLHENRGIGRQPLNWSKRLSMIKDIAKGLNFLHQSLPCRNGNVPHGNLKSSNVIICQNNQCKLSDYGFLALLSSRKSLEKLAVRKTPEFCQLKKLTEKADIYCLGIVLLEIITGKRPSEEEENTIEEGLSDWVRTVVHSDWSTDIFDIEIIAEKEAYDDMLKLTKMALECTEMAPENRPEMSQVLSRIQEIGIEQT